MNIKNLTMRLYGWSGRFQKLLFAGIMIVTALCVQSCGSTKQTLHTEEKAVRLDSSVTEVRVMTVEAVPESKVSLEIPIQSLLNLPKEASYTKKSGQANVKVTQRGDTIYVDASCDSLQRRCLLYEKQLSRIRDETNSQLSEVTKEKKNLFLKGLLVGFLLGATVSGMILISIYKKRK